MRQFQHTGQITPVTAGISRRFIALLYLLLPEASAKTIESRRSAFRAKMARERTRHARWARLAQQRYAAHARAAAVAESHAGRNDSLRNEIAACRGYWRSLLRVRWLAEPGAEASGGD